MGLIGFLAFAYVIVLTFKNLFKAKKIITKLKLQDTFLSFITNALIAYLIVRLVVSIFGIELYANYWWLAGGLSLVIVRIIKNEYLNNRSDNSIGSLTITAL